MTHADADTGIETETGTGTDAAIVLARPLRRGDHVAWVELDGEAVLLDLDQGQFHLLNPTATLVWRCLDAATELRDLAADIADAFGAPVEAVRDDLATLGADLVARGLLI